MKVDNGYYVICPVCKKIDKPNNFVEIWDSTNEVKYNPETDSYEVVEFDGEFRKTIHNECGEEFEEQVRDLWMKVEDGKIVDYSEYIDEDLLREVAGNYRLEVGE